MQSLTICSNSHKKRIYGTAKLTEERIIIDIRNRYGSPIKKGHNKILFKKIMKLLNEYYSLEFNTSKCSNRVGFSRNKIALGVLK